MSTTQPAEFPELAAVTLCDRVIATVKDSFFSGLLKPGDRIVERRVARQMGIGTPAVREALIALQEQGFVTRVTNTATYVTSYSPEEVEQLYNLRVESELLALQWAKPRHTENDLQTLEKIIHDMTDASERGQTRRFYELDLLFHRHCWQLCGNKYLAEALERIVAPLFAFVPRCERSTRESRCCARAPQHRRRAEEPSGAAVFKRRSKHVEEFCRAGNWGYGPATRRGIVKLTHFRRDQAIIWSIQTRPRYPYLGAVSARDALT